MAQLDRATEIHALELLEVNRSHGGEQPSTDEPLPPNCTE
jgi:hypothetical protein